MKGCAEVVSGGICSTQQAVGISMVQTPTAKAQPKKAVDPKRAAEQVAHAVAGAAVAAALLLWPEEEVRVLEALAAAR